jgi:hypothetical protein
VDHLQTFFKDSNVAVTYIYCNHKEVDHHKALISSLLKQMFQNCGAASTAIRPLYDHHHPKGTRPNLDDIIKTLKKAIRTYSKTFIIVDGLDECCEPRTLLNALRSLRDDDGSPMVNLLVTSRDLLYIAQDFEGVERLDIRARADDLKRYIKCRIDHMDTPRHLKDLQETIVETLVEKSHGM